MKIWYGIILAFVVLGLVACSKGSKGEEVAPTKTESGLQIEILKAGNGEEAVDGSNVSVHYVETLMDGSKFDSSRYRGEAFRFTVGGGQVIKGWDEGVAGMKVG